jgi:hypothetical protein
MFLASFDEPNVCSVLQAYLMMQLTDDFELAGPSALSQAHIRQAFQARRATRGR